VNYGIFCHQIKVISNQLNLVKMVECLTWLPTKDYFSVFPTCNVLSDGMMAIVVVRHAP
jgi:hypothetical protein